MNGVSSGCAPVCLLFVCQTNRTANCMAMQLTGCIYIHICVNVCVNVCMYVVCLYKNISNDQRQHKLLHTCYVHMYTYIWYMHYNCGQWVSLLHCISCCLTGFASWELTIACHLSNKIPAIIRFDLCALEKCMLSVYIHTLVTCMYICICVCDYVQLKTQFLVQSLKLLDYMTH